LKLKKQGRLLCGAKSALALKWLGTTVDLYIVIKSAVARSHKLDLEKWTKLEQFA